MVNDSWRLFDDENSPYGPVSKGVDYLSFLKQREIRFSEDAPEATNGILAVLSGHISRFTMEYYFRNEAMSRWFLLRVYSLPGGIGAVVSHSDITRQKKIEIMRDEFIGIASHELKTPITSIKGIVHILQLSFGKQIKGEMGKLLITMDIQLNKLSGIIGGLLVVNTAPGKKILLSNEKFDFKKLVEETVLNIQNLSPLHFLSIKKNESIFLSGDRFQLEQVVTNLLTNAVKYSPQSNQVTITSLLEDNKVCFSVKDFGIGIEKENLSKVFERFYRVKTKRKFGGFGLGLYISAEIIKAHKGDIWVESDGHSGSVFHFSIPLFNE